jgi:hypothetical protein
MTNVLSIKKNEHVYEQFKYFYQRNHLSATQIASIYAQDIIFRDPVHTLYGITHLTQYFSQLGANINTCRFEFVEEVIVRDKAHITWNMRFSHKKIAGGKEQLIRGMTLIKFDEGKIIYHEDCYDIGAMVYEHLPILGRATRWIKKRMAI